MCAILQLVLQTVCGKRKSCPIFSRINGPKRILFNTDNLLDFFGFCSSRFLIISYCSVFMFGFQNHRYLNLTVMSPRRRDVAQLYIFR